MILLTGAGGVVGSAVLELAPPGTVLSLRRHRPVRTAGPTVSGDVTVDGLGLSARDAALVEAGVHAVVHAAALVALNAPYRRHHQVNVDGTHHVVRLCERLRVPLVHVSTAFVVPHRSRLGGPSPYERSKAEAEGIVRRATVPVTVVRPSIVVGDSRDGHIVERQGFHVVLERLLRGRVAVLPTTGTTLIDFVPQDLVARAVLAAAADPGRHDELWVTAGAAALTPEQAAAEVNRFRAGTGVGEHEVRVMSWDTIERLFLPALVSSLPRGERAEVRLLLGLARHMNLDRQLPDSARVLRDDYGIGPAPDPATLLQANLSWLLGPREVPARGPAVSHGVPA